MSDILQIPPFELDPLAQGVNVGLAADAGVVGGSEAIAQVRFLSPDNLSPFGEGGPNAYAYCTGYPINFRDPSGH